MTRQARHADRAKTPTFRATVPDAYGAFGWPISDMQPCETTRAMTNRTYRITPFLMRAAQLPGISVARVLARAGLPGDLAWSRDLSVDAMTWFAVLEALVQEAGDADQAMELGRDLATGPLPPALIAFAASPDIRTGLQRLALFKPLVAPMRLAISETAESLVITLTAETGDQHLSAAVAKMEVAYLLSLLATFAARAVRPITVTLPRGTPVTDRFRAFAGCAIIHAETMGLAIRAADAALPIISADTAIYRSVEAELLGRLRALSVAGGTADRLRRELRHALPSGQVSVETIASRLRVSPRSLQRRLKEEDTSFQAILDETRAELAIIYLRDRKLSAEETSHLLAFRDPNSFYRAFRDWTGMTPAEARALDSQDLA